MNNPEVGVGREQFGCKKPGVCLQDSPSFSWQKQSALLAGQWQSPTYWHDLQARIYLFKVNAPHKWKE